MRTRLVRVRRKRPGSVRWAIALTVVALAAYIAVGMPAADRAREAMRSEPKSTVQPTAVQPVERITEDVRLPALALYAIQFGAYDGEDNARVEAARYVRRGAAGYIQQDGTLRVLGAGYETIEEAEKVVGQLEDDEDIAAGVYELAAESVLLRVTASRDQIDALKAAEQALRDQAAALGRLSFSLDRGEVTLAEAAAKVGEMAAAAGAARGRLGVQAGEQPNSVAAGLIDRLAAFEEGLKQITTGSEQSLLAFSSKMKYNYLDARIRHIAFLKELGG